MQTKDAIRAIKSRLNIVDVVRRYVADLKRNGPRWVAPCPFHQETKPSFSVNEELGTFHCFGCQASGDIFEFYGKINGLDFKESLEQLAHEAGIDLKSSGFSQRPLKDKKERARRQEMMRLYAFASSYYKEQLQQPNAALCRHYIEQRGLSREILEHFELGWADDNWHGLDQALRHAGFSPDLAIECGLLGKNRQGKAYDNFRARLIFPIKNLSNQVIAFGGRIITKGQDERKYINSSDSLIYKKGEHLYGLAQARRGISAKGFAMLTEGYMDVLTLHQFGYTNAVGGLGTALTPEQVKRLTGLTSSITLLYDADNAGRKAAFKAARMFLLSGIGCTVVLMPEGEDIDTYLRKFGNEAFERLMQKSPDGKSFCMKVVSQMAPRERLDWVNDFLGSLARPELANEYISFFSNHLNYDENILRHATRAQKKKAASIIDRQETPALNTRQVLNIRERQILTFVTRHPQFFSNLQILGADLLITTPIAKQIWALVEEHGEDFNDYLGEDEKNLLVQCRDVDIVDSESPDMGLHALECMIRRFCKASHKSSLFAAIQGGKINDDFDTDIMYLVALQQTLERKNEQS